MIKWKLMLTTVPFMVAAVALKLVLDLGFQLSGWLDMGDVGPVLTGGVFLIGFMLAGTIADYKESEKLPGEVACTLEALEEVFGQAAAAKPAVALEPLRRSLLEATNQIRAWLFKQVSQDALLDALSRLGERIQLLERDGATAHATRGLQELHNLRKSVTRMSVISRTGFLATGYAMLEVLTVIIIALMMATKFKTLLAEVVLVSFVTLIYVYMLRLIRDIDDPFEYSPEGRSGAAEVDLFPIDEYRARLEGHLAPGAVADPQPQRARSA